MAWSDWSSAARSYAGWVPNVGSHLSFSLIGTGSATMVARRTGDHRESDGSVGRYVCLVEKRQTDDCLWPPVIMRHFDPSVVQHFLLAAMTEPVLVPTGFEGLKRRDENGFKIGTTVTTEVDEQGALVGRVHILPHYTAPNHRIIQQWMLEEIADLIAKRAPNDKRDQCVFLEDVEQCVRWRSPAAVTVEFALMRTGEIRLWYASSYHDLKEQDYTLAAKQAYFFIKDMTHRHIHHDPASDQISPLVRFEMLPAKPEKADTDWRRRTIWNLAREAERQGNFKRLDKQREALGILAFADAFQATLLPYRRDPCEPEKFLPNDSVYGYEFKFIRESTRVRVDQMAAQRSALSPLLSAGVAGAIAAIALVSSLVSTRNGALRAASAGLAGHDPNQPSLLQIGIPENLIATMAAYPWAVAILTICILVTLYRVVLSDVLARNWKPWQRLRGISISFVLRFGSRSSRTAYQLLNSFYVLLIAIECATVLLIVRWILKISP